LPSPPRTNPFLSKVEQRGQDLGRDETRPFYNLIWLELSPQEVPGLPIAGVVLGISRPATQIAAAAVPKVALSGLCWIFVQYGSERGTKMIGVGLRKH
jgi:hypothetical protein